VVFGFQLIFQFSPAERLLEQVAFTGKDQDVGVVSEAVKEGGGQGFVRQVRV